MRVQFGGNTAGQFGAVIELRAVAVAGGAQWTARLTTTRYNYLADAKLRQQMEDIITSFRVKA